MTSIDAGTGTYVSVDGLEVSLGDGVLSLTLNRPDSLNSLTATMLNGVADALDQAAADPRVKVVRLGGAGRGFSSGAGISADDQSKKAGGLTVLDAANRAVRSIVACPALWSRLCRVPPRESAHRWRWHATSSSPRTKAISCSPSPRSA